MNFNLNFASKSVIMSALVFHEVIYDKRGEKKCRNDLKTTLAGFGRFFA